MGAAFQVAMHTTRRGKTTYAVESEGGEMDLQDFLEFTKTALIITADAVLTEEQNRGFDKFPLFLVDGKRNRDVRAVSPLGQIEFVARQAMQEMVLEAYQGILNRSKVLTGKYKSSHYVFFKGVQVATDLESLQKWFKSEPQFKDGDTLRIVNIQPYGRRLELLGVTAGRSAKKFDYKERKKKGGGSIVHKLKIPNGAYSLTTRSIKSKYKQNATIKFSFLSGAEMGLTGAFKTGRKGKNSVGRPYLYPTIIFRVQERGIT